jgi:hypothetical protein
MRFFPNAQNDRNEGILRLLTQPQNDRKAEEILHSANAPFRMTKKGQNDRKEA